jgi:hypothetical protein
MLTVFLALLELVVLTFESRLINILGTHSAPSELAGKNEYRNAQQIASYFGHDK